MTRLQDDEGPSRDRKAATRDPLPPPFPVGTRLRCVEGHDAYVPSVERPRDIKAHPEDWARLSGRGIEVTIDRVDLGRRGTGRQLRDEDGPMYHDDGEPMLDETRDGYSVYQVVRGAGHAAKMSGRCIDPSSAHKWQVLPSPLLVQAGDFIEERGACNSLGRVLVSGAKTFDVIWFGGSTTRYRHGVRDIRIVPVAALDAHSLASISPTRRRSRCASDEQARGSDEERSRREGDGNDAVVCGYLGPMSRGSAVVHSI